MPSPRSYIRLRRGQVDAYVSLARIHQCFDRRKAELFAAEGIKGITPAQSMILLLLIQKKVPMTARQIAELSELSDVTVFRFVKALEKSGWIKRQRDPDDGRAWLLEPTRKAHRALPRFVRIANITLDRAFAGLSRKKFDELVGALEIIRENLREPPRE